jgi:precorrin-6A/cobalt-precorrin-6A reductase
MSDYEAGETLQRMIDAGWVEFLGRRGSETDDSHGPAMSPAEEPPPLLSHSIILGRGPFATEAERELLREHRIDLIIAKNSGGMATHGKIVAARELGLPVMLLRRPPLPPAETAGSIEAALAWVGKVPG